MQMDDTVVFRDEVVPERRPDARVDPWLVLIVDDDRDVHDATVFTLRDTIILDRPLSFVHAYSGQEAIDILRSQPGIALVLLDAVMETEDAGLSAVRVIREDLGLDDVRIILRTGQPGQVPELDTITKYDINDYKTKSELTRTKLMTAVVAALRSWQQIQRIESSRRGLRKIVEASNQFIVEQGLQSFAEGVITQMAGLLGLAPEGIVCAAGPDSAHPQYQVIAAAGHYRTLVNQTITEEDNPAIFRAIQKALTDKSSVVEDTSVTMFFEGPSGRNYATWIGSPITLKDVDTNLLEIFCTNISLCASNIELVNKLKEQAWQDPVLKIPNMVALLERVQKQLDGKMPLNDFMVVLDIDGFNQINDLLGHDYGDAILRSLVVRLRELLGESVFFCRVAADVFAILGDRADFSEQTINSLSSMRMQTAESERDLSISVGITPIDGEAGNASAQLRNCFVALKRAKGEGVGQIVRYSKEIGQETRERIRLLHQLKGAFAQQRLFLVYQPQVRIDDLRVFGCEALLRWKTDRGEFIAPDRFIPLAEQAGLIVPIGMWVLRMALLALKEIHKAGFPTMRMAVNVSAMQLRRNDFIEHLDAAIADIGVSPHMLELEITESISVIGIEDTLRLLRAIRERGISIAVDDFGTGYSSLSSIDRWPVNRIKIDRSFVQNMERQEAGARLIDLVVPLGNRLSMRVLAEGVETEAQLARLRTVGCHELQGYIVSKPLALQEFIAWMQASARS
jgi:diguanylate cyclase (GGDEF)-like protein